MSDGIEHAKSRINHWKSEIEKWKAKLKEVEQREGREGAKNHCQMKIDDARAYLRENLNQLALLDPDGLSL